MTTPSFQCAWSRSRVVVTRTIYRWVSAKKDATPLLTHWSYVFLALTHRYVFPTLVNIYVTMQGPSRKTKTRDPFHWHGTLKDFRAIWLWCRSWAGVTEVPFINFIVGDMSSFPRVSDGPLNHVYIWPVSSMKVIYNNKQWFDSAYCRTEKIIERGEIDAVNPTPCPIPSNFPLCVCKFFFPSLSSPCNAKSTVPIIKFNEETLSTFRWKCRQICQHMHSNKNYHFEEMFITGWTPGVGGTPGHVCG